MDGYLKAWDIGSLPLRQGAPTKKKSDRAPSEGLVGGVAGGGPVLGAAAGGEGGEGGEGGGGGGDVERSLDRALVRQVYTRLQYYLNMCK
jgi:hypothetical protein